MKATMQDIENHPHFNKDWGRVLLPREEVEKLPARKVTGEELYEIQGDAFFNPVHWYPRDFNILEGEAGYDLTYRYIYER